MDLRLAGIVIICGNYGCGKTEIAINLAIDQKRKGSQVAVADLDLVNPYFRTREARKILAAFDVDLVLPPKQYLRADLPILDSRVAGMIRRPSGLRILDVGGEDVGATVLSSLADSFQGQAVEMLQVINPFRPHTDSVEGCLAVREKIQRASRLKVTGLVGNPNLINETGPEHILEGYRFMEAVAEASGLPLVFITVPSGLAGRMDLTGINCPVLPITRQLVPPWEKAGPI